METSETETSLDELADSDDRAAQDPIGGTHLANSDDDSQEADAGDDGVEEVVDEFASISLFEVPTGFIIDPSPPKKSSNKTLKRRKIAHKFLDGWAVGTFSHMYTGSKPEHKGQAAVYYNDWHESYYHDLNVSDYGADKFWVLLKKA